MNKTELADVIVTGLRGKGLTVADDQDKYGRLVVAAGDTTFTIMIAGSGGTKSGKQDAVRAYLAEHPDAKLNDIAEACGCSVGLAAIVRKEVRAAAAAATATAPTPRKGTRARKTLASVS